MLHANNRSQNLTTAWFCERSQKDDTYDRCARKPGQENFGACAMEPVQILMSSQNFRISGVEILNRLLISGRQNFLSLIFGSKTETGTKKGIRTCHDRSKGVYLTKNRHGQKTARVDAGAVSEINSIYRHHRLILPTTP
jgi:hypothetical protein